MEALDNQLIKASQDGDVLRVTQLLDAGAEVSTGCHYPLRISAIRGHVELAKLLLQAGSDVHVDDDYPLRMAAYHGHVEIVGIFIKAGANIGANNHGALRAALIRCHDEVVDILVKAGSDVTSIFKYRMNENARHTFITKYAKVAYRGIETAMMLDTQPRLNVLRDLFPEIKPKQINETLAMMVAMNLSSSQMAEMWKNYATDNQVCCAATVGP